jgi:hypothetical protein
MHIRSNARAVADVLDDHAPVTKPPPKPRRKR